MLKKIHRLSSVKLLNSKEIRSSLFNLKISENNFEFNRFAFVISKKIDKRASARNSIKRKFSSCIEEIFDKIKSGKDFVFYPSQRAADSSKIQLMDEITKVFSKERLLND